MKVIFVCTGNTCRSPLAEGIAKQKIPNIEFASRGIYAMDGHPISNNSHQIGLTESLAMPSHSTKFVASDLSADLILTMSNSHKLALCQMYNNTENVFTINEYVGATGEVSDPFGGTIEDYREIFNELNCLIDRLKNKILKQ
ncbi:low molecular weight protein arginine phosphatase [Staphylococcus gallinarum]|uniref:low molecular weight protein arginine phosphatase n=1 Tax=Staphylococcus gallinarum TaxID=1293 RepID=UPI002441BD99|nr:low molecular weight protein arginine phosphatase [Staphylococcus gallinarum]MEB7039999.1 low molecular weight protein arginine phosphatase [Staphylococcus gallinarum]